MFNRVNILLSNSLKLSLFHRTMSGKVRISVCQLNTRENKNENFQIGKQLIEKAKEEQSKVCLFFVQ